MFRFRLQRVLELRAQREKDAAAAAAHAANAADAARAERDAIAASRAELAQTGIASTGAATVGALHNLSFLLAQLDRRVAEADGVVDAAERTVEQTQDALRTAHQDRRAFDRLREKHHAQWRTATEQQDRQRMDEIALSRFTRTTPSSTNEQ